MGTTMTVPQRQPPIVDDRSILSEAGLDDLSENARQDVVSPGS